MLPRVPEAEKFSSHLPAVLGATSATVLATLGTSYLGWAGTLAGVIAGSLVTGGGAWWAERWLRRTTARARALREARKAKGRPLNEYETRYIAAVSDEQQKRAARGIPWALAGMSAIVVLLATAAVILFIELGTGKPVSAVVQGRPAHGLVAPVEPSGEPSPAVEPSRTPPVLPSPSASLTPSLSPSPSPPVSPGSPTASPSATGTTAPASTSPVPVPSPDISGGTP